jgi:hypothetical protein
MIPKTGSHFSGSCSSGAISVDDSSTGTVAREEAAEEILTYTVTDEALEAAAGTEQRERLLYQSCHCWPLTCHADAGAVT